MPIAQDILDRHRAQWLALGVPEPMGASEEAILAAEQRLGIRFPDEVREFYRNFGEVREPARTCIGEWDFCLPNGTALRFYHLDECYLLSDCPEFRLLDPLGDASISLYGQIDRSHFVAFADFLGDSYRYGLRCGPIASEQSTSEVVVDNGDLHLVSSTFEEFLRRCLDDPDGVENPW